MGNLLLFIISMGWMGMDQMKENKRKRERQAEREERRKNSSFRFFWE